MVKMSYELKVAATLLVSILVNIVFDTSTNTAAAIVSYFSAFMTGAFCYHVITGDLVRLRLIRKLINHLDQFQYPVQKLKYIEGLQAIKVSTDVSAVDTIHDAIIRPFMTPVTVIFFVTMVLSFPILTFTAVVMILARIIIMSRTYKLIRNNKERLLDLTTSQ